MEVTLTPSKKNSSPISEVFGGIRGKLSRHAAVSAFVALLCRIVFFPARLKRQVTGSGSRLNKSGRSRILNAELFAVRRLTE